MRGPVGCRRHCRAGLPDAAEPRGNVSVDVRADGPPQHFYYVYKQHKAVEPSGKRVHWMLKLYRGLAYKTRVLKDELDLQFLYKSTRKYYEREGQVSIDPVVLFKLLLVGYFREPEQD